jgi:hypothetical protein
VTLKVSVGINVFVSAISSFSLARGIIMLLGALNEEFLHRMEATLHGK